MHDNKLGYGIRQSGTRFRRDVKAPALVALVVLLHTLAVGAFLFIQGCQTKAPDMVRTAPPPIMPPKKAPAALSRTTPPAPVKTATRLPLVPAKIDAEESHIYYVQKGDSLSKIANRFGVHTRELATLNQISDPHKIRIGQKLILPPDAAPANKTTKKKQAKKNPVVQPDISESIAYVVQPGDSLSKIAAKFELSVATLKKANQLTRDTILIGQKLMVPKKRQRTDNKKASSEAVYSTNETHPKVRSLLPEQPEPAMGLTLESDEPEDHLLDYTVQEGDTLEEIAKLFIVSKEDIQAANDLSQADHVKPGQKLKIPPADL